MYLSSKSSFFQGWAREYLARRFTREFPNDQNGWEIPALVRLSDDDELHHLLFGAEQT